MKKYIAVANNRNSIATVHVSTCAHVKGRGSIGKRDEARV